jgi:hypothetical protein
VADAKAQRDLFQKQVDAYRRAKAEYDAAVQFKLARALAVEAENRRLAHQEGIGDDLFEKVGRRYRGIIEEYPDTAAAADAQAVLDGRSAAERKLPRVPVPPVPPPADTPTNSPKLVWLVVEAEDPSPLDSDEPAQPRDLFPSSDASKKIRLHRSRCIENLLWGLVRETDASWVHTTAPDTSWRLHSENGGPKTVYVHGYFRRDGKYVRAYFRSPPASGRWSGSSSSRSRGHGTTGKHGR